MPYHNIITNYLSHRINIFMYISHYALCHIKSCIFISNNGHYTNKTYVEIMDIFSSPYTAYG